MAATDRASDDDLMADLERVAEIVERTPSQRDYRKHGHWNDSILRYRFGGWPKVREAYARYCARVVPHASKADEPTVKSWAARAAEEHGLFGLGTERLVDDINSAHEFERVTGKIPAGFVERVGEAFGMRLDRGDDHCAGAPQASPAPAKATVAPTPRVEVAEPRKAPSRGAGMPSRTVAIVSDIHFNSHCPKSWAAFREWHADVKPHHTVILGDFLDMDALSRYLKGPTSEVHVIEEIKTFVQEANALALECGKLTVVEGNHDERWVKALFGELAPAFRDALGLSLREQCVAHGLTRHAEWVRESNKAPYVQVAQFQLSHGHNAAGRFGGGKHLAANAIAKTMGESVVRGHHHRAQMFAQTHGDRTAIAVFNPCMTTDHDYSIQSDWQRGFTILELDAPTYERATPHVIIMDDGAFSYGGKTYGVRA